MDDVEGKVLDEILREEGITSYERDPAVDDCREEREALAILAASGNTKEYLGKELSLGDVHKLSRKEVASLHLRYQTTLGRQVDQSLSRGVLKVACKVVNRVLGAVGKQLDSEQALLTDLQQDALIRRELSYGAGWIAVNGGRLVALVAALAHVGCHTESSTVAGPDASER